MVHWTGSDMDYMIFNVRTIVILMHAYSLYYTDTWVEWSVLGLILFQITLIHSEANM